MSNSSNSGSIPEMPSNSSSVKPLDLTRPPGMVQEGRLVEVAALSLRQESLSALKTVLEAEQAHHLREAAFSDDPELRLEHRGVYRFLEEFLSGTMLERYAMQAREKLGLTEAEEPKGGSPYMESDGLPEEEE